MLVYHGTNYKNLNKILKSGLKPRKNGDGNWEEYPSRTDMVYLTTAYPFYFGLSSLSDTDRKVVVLEIDTAKLKEERFYPDEDFIAQANNDIKNHDKYYREVELYKRFWKDSFKYLGNGCYKGNISTKSITRYCVIDIKARGDLMMCFSDPSISILNYRFCGEYYQRLVAWAFGDLKEFPEKFGESIVPNHLKKGFKEYQDKLSSREGVEVIKNDKSS